LSGFEAVEIELRQTNAFNHAADASSRLDIKPNVLFPSAASDRHAAIPAGVDIID